MYAKQTGVVLKILIRPLRPVHYESPVHVVQNWQMQHFPNAVGLQRGVSSFIDSILVDCNHESRYSTLHQRRQWVLSDELMEKSSILEWAFAHHDPSQLVWQDIGVSIPDKRSKPSTRANAGDAKR